MIDLIVTIETNIIIKILNIIFDKYNNVPKIDKINKFTQLSCSDKLSNTSKLQKNICKNHVEDISLTYFQSNTVSIQSEMNIIPLSKYISNFAVRLSIFVQMI